MKIVGALLSAAVIAAMSTGAFGSLLLPGAGGVASGGGPPSWVATACPNSATPHICIDFANNQAWDGIANASVTPASLLSITRPGTESYQDASGNFSTISANTLAIGNAGLQIQGQINQMPSSTICTSASSGTCTFSTGWASFTSGALASSPPSSFVHNTGDAPDGTDSDTITFPALPATPAAADDSWVAGGQCTPVTTGAPYTISFYAQAASGSPVVSAQLYEVTTGNPALGGVVVQPPASPNWQLYSITAIPSVTNTKLAIGAIGGLQAMFTTNAAALWGSAITGGTIKIAQVQCNPGTSRVGNVATTGTALNTSLVDNISATGDLATALLASAVSVRVTTGSTMQGQAAALLGNGGSTFLGKDATNHLVATSLLATGAATLWNTSAVYTGVSGSPIPVSVAAWGTGKGSLSINGSVAIDTNSRSLSGTVFLGSADGSAAPWNGNILTMEVDSRNPTLVASASQPITGVTWGGFLNWNANGVQPSVNGSTYTSNLFISYNARHNPASSITGDTWGSAWASDGNTYLTGGDSVSFLHTTHQAVFFGSLSSPGFANPPPIGSNGTNFASLLGANSQANGPCPSGAGLRTQCEWKPTSLFALNATAAGTAHDVIILMLSRQWETSSTNGPYGATYSTVTYDAAEDPPWSTLAKWQGFPTTNNANVAHPTFNRYSGFPGQTVPFPFGFAVLVSNGNQDYKPVTGDPNSLNEYVYVILNNFVFVSGQAICARIALADIQATSPAPSALSAVNGSGKPSFWQYLGTDGLWHGGGTGGTGGSAAWARVGSTAQNVTPTAGTTPYLWVSSTYLPASKRYLMTGHVQGPSAGGMVAAEAPAPWGPYTVVSYFGPLKPTYFYDPFIVASSLATDSGRNIWIMNSGNPNATAASGGLYTLWQTPIQVLN